MANEIEAARWLTRDEARARLAHTIEDNECRLRRRPSPSRIT
jgi:hypothetical protein